jgi:hypothetical protein
MCHCVSHVAEVPESTRTTNGRLGSGAPRLRAKRLPRIPGHLHAKATCSWQATSASAPVTVQDDRNRPSGDALRSVPAGMAEGPGYTKAAVSTECPCLSAGRPPRRHTALRRCIAKCSRGHGRGTRLHESRRVHGMSMSLRWPAPATAHGPRSSPIDRSITHRRRVRHEGCREFGPLHTMMVSPLLPAPGVNQTQSGCVGLPKSGA